MKKPQSKLVEAQINQYLLARRLARRTLELKAKPERTPSFWQNLLNRFTGVSPQAGR